MAKKPAKRLSVSIPSADKRCLEWLESQANVSSSLRFLIHDAMSRWGTSDVVYDVMPAAIAAVSERRMSKRFAAQLQNEVPTAAAKQEPVNDTGKQVQEQVSAPTQPAVKPAAPVSQPVAQPVSKPDEDDYMFVDPSDFLRS